MGSRIFYIYFPFAIYLSGLSIGVTFTNIQRILVAPMSVANSLYSIKLSFSASIKSILIYI